MGNFGHLPRSAPKSAFSVFFGVFWASKALKKALCGALRGRCPKLPKKHSGGHFQAWAPEHSCKWRPGLKSTIARTPPSESPPFAISKGSLVCCLRCRQESDWLLSLPEAASRAPCLVQVVQESASSWLNGSSICLLLLILSDRHVRN